MQTSTTTVRYGSFLVLPLKYDGTDLSAITQQLTRAPLRTMDLNENVKAMLSGTDSLAIGARYALPRAVLLDAMFDGEPAQDLTVTDEEGTFAFDLADSWLYVFHTQVAFLCLGLTFPRMEALQTICNPGYAESHARYHRTDGAGVRHEFSLEKRLAEFCGRFGLRKFFDGDTSALVDSYAYTLAMRPDPFGDLEEIRRLTFGLHQMRPLDAALEDTSEADIRYVYAVKNQELGAYRWGCCVASQNTSYVVASAAMDFEAEFATQAEDGLPIVLLALYEKYTCLRFTELIARLEKTQMQQLTALKKLMLDFQAFGTVTPANLSRWHNVKQIYAYLLEVNDVTTAVQDISSKLSILSDHQQELEHSRSERVINIITVFGIVSILASVQSIIQILSDGDPLIWISTVITTIGLALVMLLAVRRTK